MLFMDSIFPFLNERLDLSLHARMVCRIIEIKRETSDSLPIRAYTLARKGKGTENLWNRSFFEFSLSNSIANGIAN